jgi:flagellar biosynthesis/type III secretory pathway protein FliH
MKVMRFEFPELDQERVVISSAAEKETAKQEFANLFERVVAAAEIEEQPIIDNLVEHESPFKYQEEDLIRSRMQGYEDGYDKGYKAAKNEDETQYKNLQLVIENINSALQKIPEYVSSAQESAAQTWSAIILQAAKKLAQESWNRFPEAAAEQILDEVLALNLELPKLQILVPKEHLMAVTEKLSAILPSRKPEVIIVGDENITAGECQIHWQGGGVIRNHEQMMAALQDRLRIVLQ